MNLKDKLREVATRLVGGVDEPEGGGAAAERGHTDCPAPKRWWEVVLRQAEWSSRESAHLAGCSICQKTRDQFRQHGHALPTVLDPVATANLEPETDSVGLAVQAWEHGEPGAGDVLVAKLQPFLLQMISLVRRQRDPALQPRIDSHGIVNDALFSFLTGVQKHEFPLLENRQQVKKVLTKLVLTTLADQARWHRRQKRTPTREQTNPAGRPEHVPDHRTLGSEAETLTAEIAPWLDTIVAELRGVHEKALEIIELSCEGFSNSDIARQVGLGVRRVQQLKKLMYERVREKAAP